MDGMNCKICGFRIVIKGISLVCTGCGNATVYHYIVYREVIKYFQLNKIIKNYCLKEQHNILNKNRTNYILMKLYLNI